MSYGKRRTSRLSTQTLDMVRDQLLPVLYILRKVFSDIELLEVGANRTNKVYSSKAPSFTAQGDSQQFLNNLPGLIATFEAVQSMLMLRGMYETSKIKSKHVLAAFRLIIEMKFPSNDDIQNDPKALAEFFTSVLRTPTVRSGMKSVQQLFWFGTRIRGDEIRSFIPLCVLL